MWPKGVFVLLPVVLLSAFASAQVLGPVSGGSEPDLKASYVGSAVTCSQTSTILVPMPLLERAKLKARLATVLHVSLYDDAKGIVNIAREKEIKRLVNKLRNGWDNY